MVLLSCLIVFAGPGPKCPQKVWGGGIIGSRRGHRSDNRGNELLPPRALQVLPHGSGAARTWSGSPAFLARAKAEVSAEWGFVLALHLAFRTAGSRGRVWFQAGKGKANVLVLCAEASDTLII